MKPVLETSIASLPLLGRGKVRDIYAVGDDKLLIVTTDRLSAYDVILPTPVPEKGRVLTELANFWFRRLAAIVPNHLTGIAPETVVAPGEREQVRGRAVVVKRMQPLPIEAVVRGYLEGSGWKEYRESGQVCGIALPAGLKRASKLPQPIFTPATKAEAGHHDENISFEQMAGIVGAGRARDIRDTAVRLYTGRVLPGSGAPGVIDVGDELDAGIRGALLRRGAAPLLARWTASIHGREDLLAWSAYLGCLDPDSTVFPQVEAKIRMLDRNFAT